MAETSTTTPALDDTPANLRYSERSLRSEIRDRVSPALADRVVQVIDRVGRMRASQALDITAEQIRRLAVLLLQFGDEEARDEAAGVLAQLEETHEASPSAPTDFPPLAAAEGEQEVLDAEAQSDAVGRESAAHSSDADAQYGGKAGW